MKSVIHDCMAQIPIRFRASMMMAWMLALFSNANRRSFSCFSASNLKVKVTPALRWRVSADRSVLGVAG